jgi:L-2-hydroxyglutarate oxidase LhgO
LRNGDIVDYGHAINAAGLHADSVAHMFGVGERYNLLPFKGIYWKLDPAAGIKINHLIYPVPDLRVPFLGVHTTTTTDGSIYLGPTALPAWGRENYRGWQGIESSEFVRIVGHLIRQTWHDQDGFRRLAWQEGRRYFKPWFVQAAQAILPRLRAEHLMPIDKAGIRAQMLDKQTGKLVTDFVVEQGNHSTHVLNAISPAWTSAFPFARYVCNNFIERN